MKTKLERITTMEEELAELKLQVAEEDKKSKITLGCVVSFDLSTDDPIRFIVEGSQNNNVEISLIDVPTGRRMNHFESIDMISSNYTFVASSLSEYFKMKDE